MSESGFKVTRLGEDENNRSSRRFVIENMSIEGSTLLSNSYPNNSEVKAFLNSVTEAENAQGAILPDAIFKASGFTHPWLIAFAAILSEWYREKNYSHFSCFITKKIDERCCNTTSSSQEEDQRLFIEDFTGFVESLYKTQFRPLENKYFFLGGVWHAKQETFLAEPLRPEEFARSLAAAGIFIRHGLPIIKATEAAVRVVKHPWLTLFYSAYNKGYRDRSLISVAVQRDISSVVQEKISRQAKQLVDRVMKPKDLMTDNWDIPNFIQLFKAAFILIEAGHQAGNLDFMLIKAARHYFGISLNEPQKLFENDVYLLIKDFQSLLVKGLPILRALESVRDNSEHRKLWPQLRKVCEETEMGHELSTAFKRGGAPLDDPLLLGLLELCDEGNETEKILLTALDFF